MMRMNLWKSLAAVLLLGSTRGEVAAAGDWPIYRGDSSLRGVAPGKLPDRLALRWTYKTEAAIASSPVVAAGRAYVGSDDFHVHCVDLETGEGLWSHATEDMVEAPPLVVGDTVYVGSTDLYFYALDAATGELRWKYETEDKIVGGANWVPDANGGAPLIVVGSYDNRLYGFDGASGELRWRYETDNYVNGTPAVVGERIVFGGCDAVLHVVSAATGEALAKVEIGEACHVAGSVGIDDETVYFGHYGNQFVSISLASGEAVWTYDDPRHAFFSSPAIGAERIFFGGRDKQLHCVRRSDGERLWTFPTRRKVDGSPVLIGDKVVFGSGDGRIYVLAADDGALLWSYEIGQSVFSSPAVAGGLILIGANDGRLYAFGEESEGDSSEAER